MVIQRKKLLEHMKHKVQSYLLMAVCMGIEVKLHGFLTWALEGVDHLAACSDSSQKYEKLNPGQPACSLSLFIQG
jgi:hypothetical protein